MKRFFQFFIFFTLLNNAQYMLGSEESTDNHHESMYENGNKNVDAGRAKLLSMYSKKNLSCNDVADGWNGVGHIFIGCAQKATVRIFESFSKDAPHNLNKTNIIGAVINVTLKSSKIKID